LRYFLNPVLSALFHVVYYYYLDIGGSAMKTLAYVTWFLMFCEAQFWFNTSLYILCDRKEKVMDEVAKCRTLRPCISLESLDDKQFPEICEFNYIKWADMSPPLSVFDKLNSCGRIYVFNCYLTCELSASV
jgi:hypothetical protein